MDTKTGCGPEDVKEKTVMVRCWGGMVPAIYDGLYVRVWDAVACAYTLCHSLTGRQVARVIRLSRGN